MASLYLAALMFYILAGVPSVPFHGDESTLIYTTRDYFDQFVARDMAEVTSTASNVDGMDVNLRLLDGRVQKYFGGFVYHLTGGTADGLNSPWEWGADIAYNTASGKMPTPEVLLTNRWAMALLLALCIPAAFGIGMSIGGWPAALVFPLLITLSPNIILNGRRAMMEAPLLLFSLLTVLSALRWVHQPRLIWLIALTVSAGLALSSKHSGLLAIAPVLAALGLFALSHRNWRGLAGLIAAGLGVIGIFFVMNPAWWPNPITSAQTVLKLRSELLIGQVEFFGGYADFGTQLAAFWRQTFVGAPQFYEISPWADYIADQITAYQATPWAGVTAGDIGGILLASLALIGGVALIRRRDATAWVFGVYAIGALAAALFLTPLEWARYYLIGLPALFGLVAMGVSALSQRKS